MGQAAGLVVDASALISFVDSTTRHHEACVAALTGARGPLLVPSLTIAEVAYYAGKQLTLDAEVRLISDFAAGTFVAEAVHPADWLRIVQLVVQYADLPLGTVDASVIAAAERLNIRRVATLDRRHFSVVRPRHVDAFELLPD